MEDPKTFGRTHQSVAGAFRVRHHAEYIALLIENTGNVTQRAIRVVEIAERHPVFAFQAVQRRFIREITTLAVGYGDTNYVALAEAPSKRRIRRFDLQANVPANELQACIAKKSAGKNAGFDENLKPVADAKHVAAARGELLYGVHDGREARDRAATQVVAERETARKNDGIEAFHRVLIVPDVFGFDAEIVVQGIPRIVVAVAAGKDDNASFHGDNSIETWRGKRDG